MLFFLIDTVSNSQEKWHRGSCLIFYPRVRQEYCQVRMAMSYSRGIPGSGKKKEAGNICVPGKIRRFFHNVLYECVQLNDFMRMTSSHPNFFLSNYNIANLWVNVIQIKFTAQEIGWDRDHSPGVAEITTRPPKSCLAASSEIELETGNCTMLPSVFCNLDIARV